MGGICLLWPAEPPSAGARPPRQLALAPYGPYWTQIPLRHCSRDHDGLVHLVLFPGESAKAFLEQTPLRSHGAWRVSSGQPLTKPRRAWARRVPR